MVLLLTCPEINENTWFPMERMYAVDFSMKPMIVSTMASIGSGPSSSLSSSSTRAEAGGRPFFVFFLTLSKENSRVAALVHNCMMKQKKSGTREHCNPLRG